MSDYTPRVFDGVAAMMNRMLDTANEKSWSQIENPDNERDLPQAPPPRDRSRPDEKHQGKVNGRPSEGMTEESRPAGRGEGENTSRRANGARAEEPGRPQRPDVSIFPPAPAIIGAARTAPNVLNSASFNPSPVAAARTVSAWGGSDMTGVERLRGQVSGPGAMLMSQRDAVATRIERVLHTAGPQHAAQELHMTLRALSPAATSQFLDASGPLLASILEGIVRNSDAAPADGAVAKVADKPVNAQTAVGLAHMSAVLNKDARSPGTSRLLQDLGAVLLSKGQSDTIFTGLAQAIGVGAGAKLALAVAIREMRDRDRPSRALVAMMMAAFVRLGERIEGAHDAVLEHLGPLLIEWVAWQGRPDEEVIAALLEYGAQRQGFWEELTPRLDRVDQVGLEAIRAIRDLSGCSIGRDLDKVHAHFLKSEGIFGAIAASRPALDEIWQTGVATNGEGGSTLEAAKLMLTNFGFETQRAAFLADLSEIGHGWMLGATRTALESFEQIDARANAFQRLLAFLNGRYRVLQSLSVVDFDALEEQRDASIAMR